MPVPFGGAYITSSDDFKVVTTEGELINGWDDPENPIVPGNVDTFAELEADYPDVFAQVVATGETLIASAEEMVEAYARMQGYVIPLAKSGIANAIARDIAVRLAWISTRQRRHIISSEQAELERDRIQRGELRDIARGVLVLDADRNTDSPSMAANVYAITSSERVFSREKLSGL